MTLGVASLNLHCGLDHRAFGYPVKEAVAALDADVLLVQENWRPVGERSLAARAAADCGYPAYAEIDLVRGLTLDELAISRRSVPDETGALGLAVMSRVPWTAAATIALGAAPGDVVGERHAQVVFIPVGPAVLRIVNVHLTHRIVHGPAQLRRLVSALGSPRTPTVIGGDFNMFRPTILLATPYRPSVRGRTWPAPHPFVQLDHLLAGPGVTLERARVGAPARSDHLPVLADVRL